VQNPNTTPVDIEVDYYPLGGGPVKGFDDTIDAQSRVSYDMSDTIGGDHYSSIAVYSMTTGKKIMVERAIYGQNRGSGTDTIGGYYDEPAAAGLLSRPANDGGGFRPAQVADTRPPKPW